VVIRSVQTNKRTRQMDSPNT